MGKGSSGQTVVQNNQPPQQFMQGYTQALGMAQNAASIPFQNYPGTLVAGMSPDQQAGITATENLQGVQSPYINAASQYISNSNAPLLNPQITGLVNGATSGTVQNAANTGVGGITGAMGQYNPSNLGQWQDPYTQKVVGATQAEFANQNAQQAQQLAGNEISQGAFGGNRGQIAQDILAGQQQLAQAPTIAGLENQGFQTSLGALGQQTSLGLQGAEAAGQLGLTGAAQQAALGMQGAGTLLGANEAQGWLASQGGYGMANLGNEALSTNLEGANALMGVGGLEQQQAQEGLNVPYEQFLAAQAYPFQTAGFFGNLAEGVGSNTGGTSSTTYPSASVGSQIAGAGLAGAGILGQTGAFGQNGWLTNAFNGGGGGGGFVDTGTGFLNNAARGGGIPHRAPGGSMPMGAMPPMGTGVPDVAISVVPSGAAKVGGSPLLTQNYGSTSSGDSSNPGAAVSQGLSDVAAIAGIAAALRRGGNVPRFAAGGSPMVSVQASPYGGVGIPMLNTTPGTMGQVGGGGFGAVQDYLNQQQAGAFHGAPIGIPQPPPVPPPAPMPMGQMFPPGIETRGNEGGSGGNEGPGGPDSNSDSSGDNSGEGGQSGGGDNWRGGRIRGRDDGGSVDLPGMIEAQMLAQGSPGYDEGGDVDDGDYLEGNVHGLESSGSMRPGLTGDGGLAGGPMMVHQAALDDVNKRLGTTWTMSDLKNNPKIGKLAGDAYLEMQRARFGDDRLAAAAYNAGPNRVDQALAQLPASTQAYVNKAVPGGMPSAPRAPSAPSGPMGQQTNTRGVSSQDMPQVSGDPWKALTMAGLGIMGGNSPNAMTNIGRGALEGLKVYEEDQNKRQSIANISAYRQQQGQLAQEKEQREAGHQTTQEQLEAEKFSALLAKTQHDMAASDVRTEQGQQRLLDDQKRLQIEEGGTWKESGLPGPNGELMLTNDRTGESKPSGRPFAKPVNPNAETPADRRLARISANARSIQTANGLSWDKAWAQAEEQDNQVTGARSSKPAVPSLPTGMPAGSMWSPSRKQFRDPQGNLYDETGKPVS